MTSPAAPRQGGGLGPVIERVNCIPGHPGFGNDPAGLWPPGAAAETVTEDHDPPIRLKVVDVAAKREAGRLPAGAEPHGIAAMPAAC